MESSENQDAVQDVAFPPDAVIVDGGDTPAPSDEKEDAPIVEPIAERVPERREYPRLFISWNAALLFRPPDGEPPIRGKIKEASPIGVTFLSDRCLIERRKVVLAIRLSPQYGAPPVEVHAEAVVVNCILTRCGFRSGLNLQKFLAGREAFLKYFF